MGSAERLAVLGPSGLTAAEAAPAPLPGFQLLRNAPRDLPAFQPLPLRGPDKHTARIFPAATGALWTLLGDTRPSECQEPGFEAPPYPGMSSCHYPCRVILSISS